MLTLVGIATTRAVRPLWLLEELGLPFEHLQAKPRSDEARMFNPTGKVPVLRDGEVTIPDSTAILMYLADREGRFTAPAGTAARAEQDAQIMTALDEMDSCLWTHAKHSFIFPEDRRVPEIRDSLEWEFSQSVERLGQRMQEREFVSGDSFSIADIVVGACLAWAGRAAFPVTHDAVNAYRDRLTARPGYQRAAARRR